MLVGVSSSLREVVLEELISNIIAKENVRDVPRVSCLSRLYPG